MGWKGNQEVGAGVLGVFARGWAVMMPLTGSLLQSGRISYSGSFLELGGASAGGAPEEWDTPKEEGES